MIDNNMEDSTFKVPGTSKTKKTKENLDSLRDKGKDFLRFLKVLDKDLLSFPIRKLNWSYYGNVQAEITVDMGAMTEISWQNFNGFLDCLKAHKYYNICINTDVMSSFNSYKIQIVI